MHENVSVLRNKGICFPQDPRLVCNRFGTDEKIRANLFSRSESSLGRDGHDQEKVEI